MPRYPSRQAERLKALKIGIKCHRCLKTRHNDDKRYCTKCKEHIDDTSRT